MTFGAHVILFSTDADAAVHPAEAPGAQLYLMCDDLDAEIAHPRAAARPTESSSVR
jgi:hypothetical protein